jgi:hypothetical protein
MGITLRLAALLRLAEERVELGQVALQVSLVDQAVVATT